MDSRSATTVTVQRARNTTVAVFDKTGTLTFGRLTIVEAHILREDEIGTIMALVSESSHPVSKAVAEHLRAKYPHLSAVPLSNEVQSITGQGFEVTLIVSLLAQTKQNNPLIRSHGLPSWPIH
jgi:Cd2+-exporting ATPase